MEDEGLVTRPGPVVPGPYDADHASGSGQQRVVRCYSRTTVARSRSISVGFYRVSPYGPRPWPSETFPAEVVLDAIAELPTEKRRVAAGGVLHGERIAHVFFKKPDRRLLSIENVDLGALVRESQRGTLYNREYGPDEGPAFQTYVMFLENNVAGVVRLNRGPLPTQLCSVIEVLTGYGLSLTAMVDPKVDRRVNTYSTGEVTRLKFSALRGRAARIRQTTKLGEVFDAAEQVFPHAELFTISVHVKEKKERVRFWAKSKATIVDALVGDEDALEQFEEAEIGLYEGRAVDLLERFVLWKGSVPADESRHIDERTISLAIQESYKEQQAAIQAALGGAL